MSSIEAAIIKAADVFRQETNLRLRGVVVDVATFKLLIGEASESCRKEVSRYPEGDVVVTLVNGIEVTARE